MKKMFLMMAAMVLFALPAVGDSGTITIVCDSATQNSPCNGEPWTNISKAVSGVTGYAECPLDEEEGEISCYVFGHYKDNNDSNPNDAMADLDALSGGSYVEGIQIKAWVRTDNLSTTEPIILWGRYYLDDGTTSIPSTLKSKEDITIDTVTFGDTSGFGGWGGTSKQPTIGEILDGEMYVGFYIENQDGFIGDEDCRIDDLEIIVHWSDE